MKKCIAFSLLITTSGQIFCNPSLADATTTQETSIQKQPLELPSASQVQKRKELEQKEANEAAAQKKRERKQFLKNAVGKMSDTTKEMILHGNVFEINNNDNIVIITTAPGETEVGTQVKRDIENLWFGTEKKYDKFLRCSKSDNPDRPIQCTLKGLDLHSLDEVKELRIRARAKKTDWVEEYILAPLAGLALLIAVVGKK